MKIAIIGSGISGLTCGYYLAKEHDITVYEANDYIGGHTATKRVVVQGELVTVDTGFIVYNERTYPNFIQLLNEIGVKGRPTSMSFSVRNDANGLEYNGHTLSTLFAQRSNWFSPRFYRFIFEIICFNRLAKQQAQSSAQDETLGDFLSQHSFSTFFSENYILPMGAAIWSSTLADMRAFPLRFFLRFFLNHGLLDIVNRPQWYVIEGGSDAYIAPLTEQFKANIRLNAPVTRVARDAAGVMVQSNGAVERYDQVIFACHSDQALRLLDDPNEDESKILSAMRYQANEVVLHTDTSLLPTRPAAWAAWNYHLSGEEGQEQRLPSLTYNMNILQHINAPETLCVSLNCSDALDSDKIIDAYTYHHPVFTRESIAAAQNKSQVNGVNRTWYCGAYWHNGFHEDGVRSALDVISGINRVSLAAKGAA